MAKYGMARSDTIILGIFVRLAFWRISAPLSASYFGGFDIRRLVQLGLVDDPDVGMRPQLFKPFLIFIIYKFVVK